jgi:hypothetical protein
VAAAVLEGVGGIKEPRTVVEADIQVCLTLGTSNEYWLMRPLNVDTTHEEVGQLVEGDSDVRRCRRADCAI